MRLCFNIEQNKNAVERIEKWRRQKAYGIDYYFFKNEKQFFIGMHGENGMLKLNGSLHTKEEALQLLKPLIKQAKTNTAYIICCSWGLNKPAVTDGEITIKPVFPTNNVVNLKYLKTKSAEIYQYYANVEEEIEIPEIPGIEFEN